MKNTLLAILIISMFSGCYRDRPLPDVRAMLTKHKWYMASKSINDVNLDPVCVNSEELTLNLDCTGTFNFASYCDSSTASTDVDWYLSSDSHMIHVRRLGHPEQTVALLRIVNIYDDQLILQGNWGQQGFFAEYKNVPTTY